MPIVATCTCGQQMQVMESDIGSPIECPGCHKHVTVQQGSSQAVPVQDQPSGSASSSPPPPPPPPAGSAGQTVPPQQPGTVQYGTAPHRGTMILVFGILGMVICLPLGIAAWVMGNGDLKSMAEGRMDPSGEGLTKAGKILGIISVAVTVGGMIIGGCFGVFGVIAGAAAN